MPNLEIITIGTELLLGEITDTNSTYIARSLRDHGIDIYRITTIGDNPQRISETIKEALIRADIVITTGGLGPTVDDPTRISVSKATDRKLVFSDALWGQILNQFKKYGRTPTENNRRQAYIPEDAIPIFNPVGTAPCFIIEVEERCVISLPGVPSEMKLILAESVIPYLIKTYNLKSQIIKSTVIHTASVGESVIDEIIDDLERSQNPTVGLLAHPGQIDIRVTAKAKSESEAIEISQPVITTIHQRLNEHIYGINDETLPSVITAKLQEKKMKICLVHYALGDKLSEALDPMSLQWVKVEPLKDQPGEIQTLTNEVASKIKQKNFDLGFGLSLTENQVFIVYQSAHNECAKVVSYGGTKENLDDWALNIGLDYLRRCLDHDFN